MQDVTRIEIVIDSLEAETVLAALDRIGVHDYTAIKGVHGRGSRGERGGDPFSGVFDNTMLLVIVRPAQRREVVELVRPILKRRGGYCLVSDARSVIH